MKRVIWIVMDGVGVGEAPDAAQFNDQGSNTLGNLAQSILTQTKNPLAIPNLLELGTGLVTPIAGTRPPDRLIGAYGKAKEASTGKDTTSGHWEMAGLVVSKAFQVFPRFPDAVVERWVK